MKLVIAEKPLAAERIASILGRAKQKTEGKIKIFYSGDYLIIPLKGHITNVDFPKEYSNWTKVDLTKLANAPVEYKYSSQTLSRLIKKYAKEADEVIIACDYDREGESIGKEALGLITKVNPSIKVRRAKFSALTEEEVKHAFSNLEEFNQDLADAADARREIDLLWGAALTRFISIASGKMGSSFLSVGRVQSPTLALCVDREKEIQAFKPEPFWNITLDCEKDSVEFKAEMQKIFDEAKAKQVYSKVKDQKNAIVTGVTRKKAKQQPPTPFSTNDFLRAAANLGYSPDRALSIAEKLYTEGYISYPRTDNTVYPKSINLRKILSSLSKIPEYADKVQKILSQEKITPSRGKKKTTDHPPIHPVSAAKKSSLSPPEWRIYALIVDRFLATLAPESVTENTLVKIECAGEEFKAQGKKIVSLGWREFYPYLPVKELLLPPLEKEDTVRVLGVHKKKDETKPSPRYSAATLLKAMEDLGLGTKSTRAGIIRKIIQRGYLFGKKKFQPSQVAFSVIETLQKHGGDITSPKLTAFIEKEMDRIAEGKKTKEEVVSESRSVLSKILGQLSKHKEGISSELRKSVSRDNVLGKCPSCGGNLIMIRMKKGTRFVGCSNYKNGCTQTYPLPRQGMITPLNKTCESCGTPVIKVKRKGKRAFEMCLDPNCETKKNWGKKKNDKSDKG